MAQYSQSREHLDHFLNLYYAPHEDYRAEIRELSFRLRRENDEFIVGFFKLSGNGKKLIEALNPNIIYTTLNQGANDAYSAYSNIMRDETHGACRFVLERMRSNAGQMLEPWEVLHRHASSPPSSEMLSKILGSLASVFTGSTPDVAVGKAAFGTVTSFPGAMSRGMGAHAALDQFYPLYGALLDNLNSDLYTYVSIFAVLSGGATPRGARSSPRPWRLAGTAAGASRAGADGGSAAPPAGHPRW